MTSVALAAGVLLAGCNGDEISLANNAKANQPVPPKLLAKMEAQDMDLQSPILVRLFKQEAATSMKITAQDMLRFGVIDQILKEPAGGAHRDPAAVIATTGEAIAQTLNDLRHLDSAAIRGQRRQKFLDIGRKLG